MRQYDGIWAAGAERIAGVPCRSSGTVRHAGSPQSQLQAEQRLGEGAERLAGVLAQCPALTHLNHSHNLMIGSAVAEKLWSFQAGGLLLILSVSRFVG